MANDQEPFPSQVADKYVIRFPDGMRDRLKQAAAANNRTLNAEIVARIEESFEAPRKEINAQAEFLIEKLRTRQEMFLLREDVLRSRMDGFKFRRGMLLSDLANARANKDAPENVERIPALKSEAMELEAEAARLHDELQVLSSERSELEKQLDQLSAILKEAEDRITKQIDEAEKNNAQQ